MSHVYLLPKPLYVRELKRECFVPSEAGARPEVRDGIADPANCFRRVDKRPCLLRRWRGYLGAVQRREVEPECGIRENETTPGCAWAPLPREHRRSEERRVGKECRSRWSPY